MYIRTRIDTFALGYAMRQLRIEAAVNRLEGNMARKAGDLQTASTMFRTEQAAKQALRELQKSLDAGVSCK